ncbi:autophagy- protein 2 [Elasticomyces elasticus]|nr:autophagy- protein 2 [Elasticomyces elasticus]
MAWWQKKLLQYGLSRSGLFEDGAVNLDDLNIRWGRRSVVELKDVALNGTQIGKLARLPPSLRVDTARVVLLRLTIPADLYQSSIEAEVEGIELKLRVVHGHAGRGKAEDGTAASPTSARSPQHRKVHRRLRSPPPFFASGSAASDDEAHLPTAEELAKSFLLEEPAKERRVLEASVAADTRSLEQSITSDSSEIGEVGTGPTSVPGFLTSFLQGVADRAHLSVRNVDVRLETEAPGEGLNDVPITVRLRVATVDVSSTTSVSLPVPHSGKCNIEVRDVSIDLLSDATTFSQLSEVPSASSPATSKRETKTSMSRTPPVHAMASTTLISDAATALHATMSDGNEAADTSDTDSERMLQSQQHTSHEDALEEPSDFGIRPGDDNTSFSSRRSDASAPTEDLWSSMASEDYLPDSLLLEHAQTSRVHTSRSQSPEAVRSRRAVSPYDRAFQSPGSWPRLDESPERRRQQQSPGSWPTLDQSQQSMFQSLTPGPAHNTENPMDNKQAAIDASIMNASVAQSELSNATTSPEREDSPVEDLAGSRFYSHQDAESLYMSAMTQGSERRVPGGWESEASANDHHGADGVEEDAPSDDSVRDRARTPAVAMTGTGSHQSESGNLTPRARSPMSQGQAPDLDELVSKQLLAIDQVSLWLPSAVATATSREPDLRTSSAARNMPGTFSLYSESAASRYREPPSLLVARSGSAARPQPEAVDHGDEDGLEVQVGAVVATVDLASCRLLNKMASLLSVNSGEDVEAKHSTRRTEVPSPASPRPSPPVSIRARSFRVSLMEHVSSSGKPTEDVSLVAVVCTEACLSQNADSFDMRMGRLQAWISGSELLAFDRESAMGDSMVLKESTPDVAIRFANNRTTVEKRPIHEFAFEMLPIKLDFDLSALDDTLLSFGGLSGVLELSNSLLSDGSPSTTPTGKRTTKGVRFAGEGPPPAPMKAELKINGRLAGAYIMLRGEQSAIKLCSSTIKTVVREHGTSLTVGHVSLSGPYLASQVEAPVSVDFATLRIDYLITPKDSDLERLLSLLTPSRDKYDNDDDILLETLLRQRRKGALARLSLDELKLNVRHLDCMSELGTLGAELSKLSAVTKYLPDDERPGLLSLIRVKYAEVQLPINEALDKLKLTAQELHCAHVGLPALVALSIHSIQAAGLGETALIHPLVPLAGNEDLPMLMARMLGDEAEPTVKVKIFNTCVEYDVPTVVALTGTSATDVEGLVTDIAQSVANIAVKRTESDESSPTSSNPRRDAKRTHIELLIHDSAIGLTPDKHVSKGLLILTDTKFVTLVPPNKPTTVSLELRKAAMFVIDDRTRDDTDRSTTGRGASTNTACNARLSSALTKQGFASVGSLMSAQIKATVGETGNGTSNSVVVDLSNELLLLETCADSTQTLFAVLGGLAPPAPPSKQPKYQTELMTIEDMMASFTGEPVIKASAPAETLFDVEKEPDRDAGTSSNASLLDARVDDLLLDSEMSESLYGPVGSMFDGAGAPDEDDADEFSETVQSLLEDDPFEMTDPATETCLGDAALEREIAKQYRPVATLQSVDLGLYEIEDLGLDALGVAGSEALGSRHRFNAPTSKGRELSRHAAHDKLPFRLRLRDTHLIWNLYDGYDWQRTRDGITQVVEQVEARAEERKARRRRSHQVEDEEEPVISDFLFNSIYVGVPTSYDAQELRRQINRGIDDLASETESVPMSGTSRPTAYSASGRPLRQQQRRRLKLERSKAHKVAFELKGISADLLVYPAEAKNAVSDLELRVRDLDIFDNVPTSTWRKFLTSLDDGAKLREMCKPMVHIDVSTVRTLQDLAASELIIHASVLPLRLHVDQDALDFIVRFFEFKDDSASNSAELAEQPFIQRLEVDTVDLCLDYKPKRIDYGGLRSGHTNELMNMITLDGANIRLRHAIVYGIRGFEPLHKTLNDIWMPDVKRNQLPTVLAGLAPVRGLVNIGSGMRDVVAIPIREYRKDGRIVRSIQKGALHFGKTTTSELARLGAKLAIGTQNVLQGAEGLLSPSSASPSSRPGLGRRISSDQTWHDVASGEEEEHEQRAISAYANQPIGVLSGLRSARLHLEHDLVTARDALIAVQGEILESNSPGAAAAAVARYAPTVILRPVIGASRAIGTTLLGVGNQIDRQNMRRMDDKYKRR